MREIGDWYKIVKKELIVASVSNQNLYMDEQADERKRVNSSATSYFNGMRQLDRIDESRGY